MRHLLSLILRDHGWEARAVAGGEEALRELAVRAFADVLAVKVDQCVELALSGHQ